MIDGKGPECGSARTQWPHGPMAPMALMARLRALIARDPFFAAALAAGAGLRLLAMLGYPGALWFSGDSYVYLGAALRPRPDLSKTTGYSLFLRALEPFHSLTLVTGVQHLMGLGVAVMIYLLLRRSGVPPRWATVATLPVLLDGFEIEDEHMVMAEALFTFLIMLAMLLILWRARVPWPVALLAGLLAGYAVDVRSEGLPVLVLFPAFLLLRALTHGGWRNWRGWLAAIVMAAGCAAPVLGYAAWFHSWTGSYALTRSDGFYLWGRVSSFAECSVIKPPADELKICPSGSPSSRTPPGDYIWHAPQVHDLAGGPVSVANNALLRDFAIRAVEAQPLGYLHTVLERPGARGGVAAAALPGRGDGVLLLLPPEAADHTGQPLLDPRRHRLLRRRAVRPRHPEPRRRAVRHPDRRVRAGVLHLRAAVRAHPGHRPRRGGPDSAAAATPDPARRVPAASAACCPGSPRSSCSCSRSRSPTSTTGTCSPSSRSPAWPPAWPSPRPGARPPDAATGPRAARRPHQPGARKGRLTELFRIVLCKSLPCPYGQGRFVQERP